MGNASAADGGPNCKGLIDLKNTDIEVVADPKSTTIFSLKGNDGLWSSGSLVKVSTLREDRVYTFDAQGSDHPRETWMKYISMHMERACRLREHAAAANQFSRVGEGSATPAENVFKVGAAIWYKGHCKELRDDQMLVYGMAGTVINVNEDGSRLVLKFDGLKFQRPSSMVGKCWRLSGTVARRFSSLIVLLWIMEPRGRSSAQARWVIQTVWQSGFLAFRAL